MKLGDTYDKDIFTCGRLPEKEPITSKKAIQNLVFTDSDIESQFAKDLEAADEVAVYAKLPRSFQIPTPVGNYAPDWAIVFKKDKVQYVYFVAETKGDDSPNGAQLKKIEENKIECAKKLFNELSTNDVRYVQIKDYNGLKNRALMKAV